VLAPGKNFMIWFLLMSIPPFHVFWNLETAPETRVPLCTEESEHPSFNNV
jgi:hypothetical protein